MECVLNLSNWFFLFYKYKKKHYLSTNSYRLILLLWYKKSFIQPKVSDHLRRKTRSVKLSADEIMSFQCMVVFGLFSAIYAYQGTNPGYAYVDKSECQPYGSVVVESDDCKTSLNCNIGSSSSAQILYCFRDVDQTLHGSLCVYQYLSERCNKTLHGKIFNSWYTTLYNGYM